MRWKGGLEDIGWVKRGGITMLETRDGGESGTLYVAVIFYGLSRITLPSRVNLLWLTLQAVPVPFQRIVRPISSSISFLYFSSDILNTIR